MNGYLCAEILRVDGGGLFQVQYFNYNFHRAGAHFSRIGALTFLRMICLQIFCLE